MAMIKCPECKKEVSSKAKTCPNCGAAISRRKRGSSIGCLFFMIVIIGALVCLKLGMDEARDEPLPEIKTGPLTPEQVRSQKISQIFSAWNGSVPKLELYIKRELMHNPKSYEHIKTSCEDTGELLLVTTTFRGTNAMGGVVRNTVTAKVDINGDVIEIVKTE